MLNYHVGVIIVYSPQYLLQDEATPAEPTYKEMSLSKDMISPMDSLAAGSPGKGLGYFLQFDTPKSSQSRSRSRKRTVEKQKAARKSQSTPRKVPAIEKDIQPVAASKKPGSTSQSKRSGSSSPTRRRSSSLADSLTRFKELQALRQKLDSPITDLSDNMRIDKTGAATQLQCDSESQQLHKPDNHSPSPNTTEPSHIEVSGDPKALLRTNDGMTPNSLCQPYNILFSQSPQTLNDFNPSSHNSRCIKTPTDHPQLTKMDSVDHLIGSFQHRNYDCENDEHDANPTCDMLYVDHNDNKEDRFGASNSHWNTEQTSTPQNKPHVQEETTPILDSKDCKHNVSMSVTESDNTTHDTNIQGITNFLAECSSNFSSNKSQNGATNLKPRHEDVLCPGSISDKDSATADSASSLSPSQLIINVDAENLKQEVSNGGITMNTCSEVDTESDAFTEPDSIHHYSSVDINCKTTKNSEEIKSNAASPLLNNETVPVTNLHNISSDFQLNIRNNLGKGDAAFSAPIDHHHESAHHASSEEMFVDYSDIETASCNRESQEEGKSELSSEARLDLEVCEERL